MSQSKRNLRRTRLSFFVQVALTSVVAIPLAHAASCRVNSSSDDPTTASSTVTSATTSGTLRDCILAANLMTGSTGVPTTPGMTIDLSTIAG